MLFQKHWWSEGKADGVPVMKSAISSNGEQEWLVLADEQHIKFLFFLIFFFILSRPPLFIF